ncbi:hypothetical protein [Nitrosomonas nitrosa]|nr:hypothetical protein [Nitrosomonas nitrosa]
MTRMALASTWLPFLPPIYWTNRKPKIFECKAKNTWTNCRPEWDDLLP